MAAKQRCIRFIAGRFRMLLSVGKKAARWVFMNPPTGGVKVSASVGRVIDRHNTKRSIRDDADRSLAQEWSKVGSKARLLSHRAARIFRKELSSLQPVAGNGLTCVHGRTRELIGPKIDSWLNMGPEDPPAHGGRYNAPGMIALYLCDCERGVLREVNPRSDPRVFLQDYEISLDRVLLADCTASNLTNFANAVFEAAESCMVEGLAGPSNYEFSQAVGQLVREAGFEGMLVPGVRDTEAYYRNVVLFDEARQWKTWSLKRAGFRISSWTRGD